MATELAGFRVAFLEDGESASDGIRRVKPLVVLVDAAHPVLREPASLGPALMTGAAVVFYGREDRLRDVRTVAATARAAVLVLPEQIAELPRLLTAAALRGAPRADRTPSE